MQPPTRYFSLQSFFASFDFTSLSILEACVIALFSFSVTTVPVMARAAATEGVINGEPVVHHCKSQHSVAEGSGAHMIQQPGKCSDIRRITGNSAHVVNDQYDFW